MGDERVVRSFCSDISDEIDVAQACVNGATYFSRSVFVEVTTSPYMRYLPNS